LPQTWAWRPAGTELTIFAQNGGYINPPRIKRQFRDPHADWWDKQERRNFGEPVHEDHDILGMFSPYEYTWITPGKGLFQIGVFVAVFLSVCYAVKLTYPDRASYPREFEGGLERELGGPGGVRASHRPHTHPGPQLVDARAANNAV
jgi:NADH dehydrogenase (ubiquinone) 1 beta subcomplex subunit 8